MLIDHRIILWTRSSSIYGVKWHLWPRNCIFPNSDWDSILIYNGNTWYSAVPTCGMVHVENAFFTRHDCSNCFLTQDEQRFFLQGYLLFFKNPNIFLNFRFVNMKSMISWYSCFVRHQVITLELWVNFYLSVLIRKISVFWYQCLKRSRKIRESESTSM